MRLSTLVIASVFVLCNTALQATAFYMQAITAAVQALALPGALTTAGLLGVKLALGAKLLYFLGHFGKLGSLKSSIGLKSHTSTDELPQSFGDFQAYNFPQPYLYPYAYQFAMGQQGIPQGPIPGYPSFPPVKPSGFVQTPGIQQWIPPAGNFPPFIPQMPNQFPSPKSTANKEVPDVSEFISQQSGSKEVPSTDQSIVGSELAEETEELESFFAFLQDMDDNLCISRLMCSIGASPLELGEFGTNVNSIMSSLGELPDGSKAAHYHEIFRFGFQSGETGCSTRYLTCDDDAYKLVKDFAPAVDVPQNV